MKKKILIAGVVVAALLAASLTLVFRLNRARLLVEVCPALETGRYLGRIIWDDQEGESAALSDEEFRAIFKDVRVTRGEGYAQTPSPAFELRLTDPEGVGWSAVVGEDGSISVAPLDDLDGRTFWQDCDGQTFSRLYACHLKNGGAKVPQDVSAPASPSPAAAPSQEAAPEVPEGYALCAVRLPSPSSKLEKTHHGNAGLYSIDPFLVTLVLPQGWTVQEGPPLYPKSGAAQAVAPAPDFLDPIDGLFNLQYILDEADDAVGYLGYFLAPVCDDPETAEDPQALFAGINLSRHRFDCYESYTPVARTDGLRVATTAVIREALDAMGSEAYPDNDGILVRDEKRGVCVGIELERGRFTAQELTDLAARLTVGEVEAGTLLFDNGAVKYLADLDGDFVIEGYDADYMDYHGDYLYLSGARFLSGALSTGGGEARWSNEEKDRLELSWRCYYPLEEDEAEGLGFIGVPEISWSFQVDLANDAVVSKNRSASEHADPTGKTSQDELTDPEIVEAGHALAQILRDADSFYQG